MIELITHILTWIGGFTTIAVAYVLIQFYLDSRRMRFVSDVRGIVDERIDEVLRAYRAAR